MREDHGISTLIDLHEQVIDQGGGYEFRDAQQLLIDFFNEVDRVLKEARQK